MRHDPIGDLGIAALDALVATWSEPGPEDPGALAPRDLRQQYDAQKLAHDRRRGQALTDLRMVAMTAIPGLLARLRMAEAVRDRVGAVLVAAGCSCDCGHDSEGFGHDEPGGRFVPAITDRERACLRGEHEATGDMDSTAGLAVWLGERAGEAWCCRHCRALFVPRSG